MKKTFLLLLALPLLTSCSKSFYQVATVSSDELELKEDGVYVQSTPDYEILYDFWDNAGIIRFVFHNKSESDIYIDLTRSFFIKNGLSYDYYQNRTWTNGSVVSSTSSLSMVGARSSFASATGQLFYQPSIIATLGLAGSYALGVGGSVSSTSSSAVAYREPEGIWVPAHSSRVFNEFSIMSGPYRECGFDRYPRGENTILEFTPENSPVVFTNRLYIKINDVEKQITDNFYVSSVKNLNEKKETYYDYDKDYCGNDINSVRRWYMKDASPNKFYTKYIQDTHNDTKKGASKSRTSF